jgi:hypothetical protein
MCFFRKNAILVQLIGVDDQEDDEELHDLKSGYEVSQFLFVEVTAINCVWQSIV